MIKAYRRYSCKFFSRSWKLRILAGISPKCFEYKPVDYRDLVTKLRTATMASNRKIRIIMVADVYFYSVLIPLSCFNFENAFFGSFSLDSLPANDERQLQVTLCYRCCLCTNNSSTGFILPVTRKPTLTARWLSLIFANFLQSELYFLHASSKSW